MALDPILTTFGEKVGVHVESMGKYSFQKGFRLREENKENKTSPIHTAIITVDEGEVRRGSQYAATHVVSGIFFHDTIHCLRGIYIEHARPDLHNSSQLSKLSINHSIGRTHS